MSSHSVKIGASFFAGAFKDYSNWQWAWVREIMQNCIDSPRCNKVDVQMNWGAQTNQTVVTVTNNGEPMTEDTLLNKFLALGESGKRFQDGATGGFGKAKEILCFAHQKWDIKTGSLRATGHGGDYDLAEQEHFHGTETTVWMGGDQVEPLIRWFNQFAQTAQWSGTLTVNGIVRETNLKKGSKRREFPWGVIYTNQSIPNTLVCRVNGIPMFTKWTAFKGTVIVELVGQSSDVLTSNRDGLKWNPSCELDQLIAEIQTNRTKAFQDKTKTTKVRFPGYKLAGLRQYGSETPGVSHEVEVGVGEPVKIPAYSMAVALSDLTPESRANLRAKPEESEEVQRFFRPEFFLKSDVEGVIPNRFMPDTFSANSMRLVSNWVNLLLELASLTGLDRKFAIGFIFSQDNLASCEKENGEWVVYVNPAILAMEPGKARQFKTRWKFSAAGNWELLATAVHEFAHLEGYMDHDEDYAVRITDLMTLVLQNRTRFSRHFSSTFSWPTGN